MSHINTRTHVIIQARMRGTRLPGKVMLPLAGIPMLGRVLHRVQRARGIDNIIIATSPCSDDDVIADYCTTNHIDCFRGSEADVLDRFYKAASCYHSTTIIRITADCPFIDPDIIGQVIHKFAEYPNTDYASNTVVRTFPRGLDTEIMTFTALESAWQNESNPALREHVTPYLYLHPDIFKICQVVHPSNLSHLRWTVDTQEDFMFASKVYDHFQSDSFSWIDVLNLLENHPDWKKINQHIKQKKLVF